MKSAERARNAILEVVDNQIRLGTPPETKLTFERLIKEGYSESEARQLIAWVVAGEMFRILKYQQPYDEAKFVSALNALPQLPE